MADNFGEDLMHFESLFHPMHLRNELLEFFDDVPEDENLWGDLTVVDRSFQEALEAGEDPIKFYRDSKYNLSRLAWNCAVNDERTKALATVGIAQKHGYKTAIDWGAGIGTTAFALALSGLKVTATEVAEQNIELMKMRRKRFDLASKDFRIVDLVTGKGIRTKHDMVVCTEVLEHVEDPHGLMRILDKRLKPGGTAVMSWSFVNMPTHLPQHFDMQAPHPDQLLTMGFGQFVQDEIGWEFKGYPWFNNMEWYKPAKIEKSELVIVDELPDMPVDEYATSEDVPTDYDDSLHDESLEDVDAAESSDDGLEISL